MRDDPDFNIDLVQEIEKFPCLYDPTHIDYPKRNIQDRVWKELAEKMGEPVDAMKSRWKNLRSRHYKVKNHSLSGVKRKSYYLAEYLQFLDKVGETRPAEETFYDVHDVLKVEVDDTIEHDVRRPVDVTMFRDNSQMSHNIGMSDTSEEDLTQGGDDRKPPLCRIPLNNGSVTSHRKGRATTSVVKTQANYVNQVQGSESRLSLQDPDMAFMYSLVPDVKCMRDAVKRKFKVDLLRLIDETLSAQ